MFSWLLCSFLTLFLFSIVGGRDFLGSLISLDILNNVCATPNLVYGCNTEFEISRTNPCNRTQEMLWLEEFYYTTNGAKWFNNTNWLKQDTDYVSRCL